MKVFVLSAYDRRAAHALDYIRAMAAHDRRGVHQLVDDPDQADLIIFAETHVMPDPFYEAVYWHPLRRRYPHKSVVYHDNDEAFGMTPGFFPSLRAGTPFARGSLGASYYARITNNESIRCDPTIDKIVLASFWGASNSAVRRAIFAQNDSAFDLRDTSSQRYYLLQGREKKQFESDFVDSCLKSHFVLCPAGCGPSSYRLFECLEMGVTPVILSDDWVPPRFIPWDDIALRIAERDVPDLSAILRDNVGRFSGQAARDAHVEFFGPETQFHHFVETAAAVPTRAGRAKPFNILSDYRTMLSVPKARMRYVKWHARRTLARLSRKQG